MSDNKHGWALSKVGEFAELIRGVTYSKDLSSDEKKSGYKPILRANNINDGLQFEDLVYVQSHLISQDQFIKKNDIIFAMSSGSKKHVGKSALAAFDFEGAFGAFCGLLRPSKHIEPKYLAYYFQSGEFRKHIEAISKGTNINNLKREHILDFEFRLPPLNEQKRIVAKIEELFSELDSGIESLKTARAQLKVYRQAVLKHAFEGKLTAAWREKNKDKLESPAQLLARIEKLREADYKKKLEQWKKGLTEKPKKIHTTSVFSPQELDELSELPESWKWVRWEDILDFDAGAFKRGPFGSALKKEFFVKHSKYKVYEQYCPINDDCSFERYYITEEKFKELEGFAVKAHDFLISCSGVTLGRITQVPMDFKEGIINQALLRVRLNKDAYDATFFKQLFRSRYFQKRIFENSTGTAIPNVKGVSELKAIAVPLCSLEEQKQILQEIEKCFSVIDKMQSDVDENLQKSEALRQSILKKAFSGQLVAQNPADEPASALLERIRSEKQKSKEKPASKPKKRAA